MSWASVCVGFIAGFIWTVFTMAFGMAYQAIRAQSPAVSSHESEETHA